MKPLITSIAPGSGLRTPLLARGGRVLVGLSRDDAGLVLCALSLDSGAVLWTASLATRATLCLHEQAGCVATSEPQRLPLWDLDTGAPRAPSPLSSDGSFP